MILPERPFRQPLNLMCRRQSMELSPARIRSSSLRQSSMQEPEEIQPMVRGRPLRLFPMSEKILSLKICLIHRREPTYIGYQSWEPDQTATPTIPVYITGVQWWYLNRLTAMLCIRLIQTRLSITKPMPMEHRKLAQAITLPLRLLKAADRIGLFLIILTVRRPA